MVGKEKKLAYFKQLKELMLAHSKVLVCGADNVASKQFQDIRLNLRGKAIVLMGKNTLMRKALREMVDEVPGILSLVEVLVGNIGLVFTNDDPVYLRDEIKKHSKPAVAKAGSIAQVNVVIPAGPTGLEPTQIAFLQALNIATKIVKGQIEIMNPVNLLTAGEKVNQSQAALLLKLGLKPFLYGLELRHIFEEGSVVTPDILDIRPEDIIKKFGDGLSNIAAVSLATGYPTLAAVPHAFRNGLRDVMAVSLGTNYTYKQIESLKKLLDDPEALAAAARAAAASAPAAAAAAPAAAAAAEPEPEKEESDEDMGFGLFD